MALSIPQRFADYYQQPPTRAPPARHLPVDRGLLDCRLGPPWQHGADTLLRRALRCSKHFSDPTSGGRNDRQAVGPALPFEEILRCPYVIGYLEPLRVESLSRHVHVLKRKKHPPDFCPAGR